MRRPSHGLELKTVFLITKIHLLSLRGSRTIKKVPCNINPLTPVSDQDRISLYYIFYNITQTSDENKEKYQLWDY